MSSDGSKVSRKTGEFWRSCRFLYPHRAIVVVSICCALFVGLASAGGLSTMLPLMRVFIEGDTVPNWINRQIVEKRLEVKLSDAEDIRLLKVDADGPAGRAGIKKGQVLTSTDGPYGAERLSELSDPEISDTTLTASDGTLRRVPLN